MKDVREDMSSNIYWFGCSPSLITDTTIYITAHIHNTHRMSLTQPPNENQIIMNSLYDRQVWS